MKNAHLWDIKIVFTLLFGVSTLLLWSCQPSVSILFEDDFEAYGSGDFKSDVWIQEGHGLVHVDTTFSYSGDRSIHFSSGEGYSNRAFITLKHIFPMPSQAYTGSMKMFVEEASPDGIHWTMIQSTGKVEDRDFRSEVRFGGQHNKKLMANYDTSNGVSSDCWQHSDTQIPEQRWFDVKWTFNSPKNEMNFWLDGQLISALSVHGSGQGCGGQDTNGAWLFPILENISIGWVDYQTGGGSREVWIDDIKIESFPER